MKNMKKILALALVVATVLAVAVPAMALTGGYNAAAQYLSTSTMKQGGNNNATGVKNLQIMLSNRGYNPGPIDGIYGPLTANAVSDFQSDNGLSVDGQCGRYTKTKLWEVLPYIPTGCVPIW